MSVVSERLFRDRSLHKGKRERTRSALLDSAVSVFADKGIEAASINDITTHAGMANGTFYNYYRDKQEILEAVSTGLAIEVTRRINDEMEEISDPATRIVTATAMMLFTSRQAPEWIEVLLESISVIPELQSGVVSYLRQDLELGADDGSFQIEVDLLLVNQFVALIRAAVLLDRNLRDETIYRTCESVLRLLGVPAGRSAAKVKRVLKDDSLGRLAIEERKT